MLHKGITVYLIIIIIMMEVNCEQRTLLDGWINSACRAFQEQYQKCLTDEDRLMLRDLARVALVVNGPVLASIPLWKFLGGDSRMSYAHFKKLGMATIQSLCPQPLAIKDAMVLVCL